MLAQATAAREGPIARGCHGCHAGPASPLPSHRSSLCGLHTPSLEPPGCVHGPIRPRALAWRGRGAGDAAVFLEALVSGHSDLRPRKLVRRPSVHPELGQGQVVAGTQPPGPVLACLITYPGSENSGSHLDLGRGTRVCSEGNSLLTGLHVSLPACPPKAGTQNPQLSAASRGGSNNKK